MAKRKQRKKGQRSQQQRVAALRRRIAEASGESVVHGVSPNCPPDVEERFLEQVLAFEQIGATPLFDQLVTAGVALPAPHEISDHELAAKLDRVFEALAGLGVYVQSTDHLSDRELYERLWRDTLRVPETTMPENPNLTCLIDLVMTGSLEDNRTWLTYYATEDDREAWREDFPDNPIPQRKKRPYHRDRRLPRWPPGRSTAS